MRKLIVLTALAVVVGSGAASAQVARTSGWYGGVAYQGISMDAAANVPKNITAGVAVKVGRSFSRYFAAEAGFMKGDGAETVTAGVVTYRNKFSVSGPTLDAVLTMPLGASGFSVAATGGASYLTGRASSTNTAAPFDFSKAELGYRGGLGVQWMPVPAISFDVFARYQSAKFSGAGSSAILGTLGLTFRF